MRWKTPPTRRHRGAHRGSTTHPPGRDKDRAGWQPPSPRSRIRWSGAGSAEATRRPSYARGAGPAFRSPSGKVFVVLLFGIFLINHKVPPHPPARTYRNARGSQGRSIGQGTMGLLLRQLARSAGRVVTREGPVGVAVRSMSGVAKPGEGFFRNEAEERFLHGGEVKVNQVTGAPMEVYERKVGLVIETLNPVVASNQQPITWGLRCECGQRRDAGPAERRSSPPKNHSTSPPYILLCGVAGRGSGARPCLSLGCSVHPSCVCVDGMSHQRP